ncbi:antibiotic biosynthesis monooxygenase [Belnapia sp. T6]|uniref:Antibiotic biosynthesis monooxygenase n=1 Tax=Belnapia mucosa TaxID=2804532 RepID=A0ABS1UYJ6_9PROT|nr:antibiotic biosynthesis monooxygenase [Belnapia mucosa]MBL6454539.1 antibiotic biosynthesis monooxygenase [Belnapia mucosa]
MHIMISRYAGAAGMTAEAAPKAQQGLVPLLRAQHGFLGYAVLGSEQGDIVSVSFWESATAAANSREKLREWVMANLSGLSEPTERFIGDVGPHAMVAPQSDRPDQSLYCIVRKAEGLSDKALQDEARNAMLAAAQKAPGFLGIYYVRSAENPSQGVSVLLCDTREHAAAIHEETMEISKRQQPHVNVRVAASGQTAVLAMA